MPIRLSQDNNHAFIAMRKLQTREGEYAGTG